MLEEFEGWFNYNESRLKKSYKVKLTKSPKHIDKRSVYIDLESESALARITLWTTKECEVEILDIRTGEVVLYDYKLLHDIEDLHRQLESALLQIASLPNTPV